MSQKPSGDQAIELLVEGINPIFENIDKTPFGSVKSSLYAGVVTAITTFQQSSPDEMTAGLFVYLGYALTELGRYDEAEDALRTATKLDPDNAAAHGNLGYTLTELGRYDEAVEAHRTAIKLDPDYAAAHGDLGYALIKLERYDEAEDALRTATKLDPDCATAHGDLGYALIKLERYDEAEEALRTAIELDPDYAAAHGNLGYALDQLGRHDEAVDALEKAIELDPTLPYPHRILAEIRLHRHPDNTDAALSHLKDAFDRAGRSTEKPFLFSLYESTIAASPSPDEAQETLRQWSRPQDMAPV